MCLPDAFIHTGFCYLGGAYILIICILELLWGSLISLQFFFLHFTDFIKNLIERKIYIKAVRFICAFKLVDKFPPVPLLKKYLENSRSSTKNSCKRKKSLEEKVSYSYLPPFP